MTGHFKSQGIEMIPIVNVKEDLSENWTREDAVRSTPLSTHNDRNMDVVSAANLNERFIKL
jgi:hypothetical protein